MTNNCRNVFISTGHRCSIFAVAGILASTTLASAGLNSHFNQPGDILIADQFNNRVIEATPGGNIVWQFGLGPTDFSPKSIIGCNDAQRVGSFTLMAGTSTPPGVVPQAPGGVADNRVILVDPFGNIVWQYGRFGKTGSTHGLLNTPVQCTWLPNTDVLITDQGNNRIIEVNLAKKIVWQYPGSNTNASDQLNSPNSAELLENGHILIADENNNRAIEVDANDNLVWQFFTDTDPLSVPFPPGPLPTRAVRLANGDTLISDQFNNRVIRVNMAGTIVMSYGLPLAGGPVGSFPFGNNFGYDTQTTQNGLYSPYDAKIVGDYTGLTPPFDSDGDADDN